MTGSRRRSNEQLVRRYLRDAWADGDVARLDLLLSPDFCDHDAPPGYGDDLAEHRRLVADMAAGMHDRRLRVLAMVADDESVAVRLETAWTQRGDLLGVPADGRQVVLQSMDMYRLRDGRISESWHCEDFAGAMRRLG